MNLMEQIQNHPNPSITLHPTHVESLSSHVTFFQQFLQLYSHGIPKELESRIADATHAAEDVIESHVVDQIQGKNNKGRKRLQLRQHVQVPLLVQIQIKNRRRSLDQIHFTFRAKQTQKLRRRVRARAVYISADRLQDSMIRKVILEMDSVMKEVVAIKDQIGIQQDLQPQRTIIPNPSSSASHDVVGFDDILTQLMDKLTGYPSSRQIIPIHGMGGIGKTTLARTAYENKLIVQSFDILVWVTISQEYNMREIILEILFGQKEEDKEKFRQTPDEELGDELYKRLYGRRYLVILDDIWSIKVWEKIKRFFPDNNNGARIVITTRLSNLVAEFGSENVKLDLLDEEKGWNLLCKTVFREECCPAELEEIGREIAKSCKGLPLSIVVIGGLLAKSKLTQEYWTSTSQNLNQALYENDDQRCTKIIYTSYNNLPIHLRPCLLYMGAFPEDKLINSSTLIDLWVAEGFIQPATGKTLEVVAREHLEDLIDRNLILAKGWDSLRRIKFCSTHDLVRDFCNEEARNEKFFWVVKRHNLDKIAQCRRVVVDQSMQEEKYLPQIHDILQSTPLARSLLCDIGEGLPEFPQRLLRVLKMEEYVDYRGRRRRYSPEDIFRQVNSRLLYFNGYGSSVLPSSLCLLWNLHTLIIRVKDYVEAPVGIWKMHSLRHVKVNCLYLPDPQNHEFILSNLQTLSNVGNFICSDEVIKRIPNVTQLKFSCQISEDSLGYQPTNLGRLEKLENLYCFFMLGVASNMITFPLSLKKLVLSSTGFNWEDINTKIGSLPHLQVLKLKAISVKGEKWDSVEGKFCCLRFLEISQCRDFAYWTMESTHFPCLERLRFHWLFKLTEIPSEVGDIPTLQCIEVNYCADSIVSSAMRIKEEQEELDNVGLQILVKE